MTPISILSYQGRPIRLRGTMLNLTDMWRAAGRPENRRPIDWLVLEETARFRAHAQTHWTEPDGPVSQNIIQDDIIRLDPDGFVATVRGRHGGTWAHWQLALAYARYLSPEFHLWCNTVVRAAMEWPAALPAADHDPLWQHLARGVPHPASPVRHARAARGGPDVPAALRAGTGTGQPAGVHRAGRGIITRVVATEPFGGQCPCCRRERVLTEAGRVVPGAEFDHFFHRGLNRPEHGWLICAACHAELTHGGYLARFMRDARVPRLPGRRARAPAP